MSYNYAATSAFSEIPRQYRRVVSPYAEPIHRDECKGQASLTSDITQFDADFDRWIAAARDLFEQQAEIALLAQSWELVLNQFPIRGEPIDLLMPPVRSVTWIKYTDMTGATISVDAADFLKDLGSFPGQIAALWGFPWPIARVQPRAVEIRFTTGYAAPVLSVDATANTLTVSPNDFTANQCVRLGVSGGSLPSPLALRTDYYVVNPSGNTIQLSATSGGSAIDITSAGSGQIVVGEIPDQALQAIRLMVGHYWRNREAVTDLSMIQTPLAWDSLVAGCRWR